MQGDFIRARGGLRLEDMRIVTSAAGLKALVEQGAPGWQPTIGPALRWYDLLGVGTFDDLTVWLRRGFNREAFAIQINAATHAVVLVDETSWN